MDGSNKTIAERLRTARETAGLTQSQSAKLLGLHRPSISEIEAGRRKVSGDELKQFADIYGVGVAWLAGERAASVHLVMIADYETSTVVGAFSTEARAKAERDRLLNTAAAGHDLLDPPVWVKTLVLDAGVAERCYILVTMAQDGAVTDMLSRFLCDRETGVKPYFVNSVVGLAPLPTGDSRWLLVMDVCAATEAGAVRVAWQFRRAILDAGIWGDDLALEAWLERAR